MSQYFLIKTSIAHIDSYKMSILSFQYIVDNNYIISLFWAANMLIYSYNYKSPVHVLTPSTGLPVVLSEACSIWIVQWWRSYFEESILVAYLSIVLESAWESEKVIKVNNGKCARLSGTFNRSGSWLSLQPLQWPYPT